MPKLLLILFIAFGLFTSCAGPKGQRNYSSAEQVSEEQPPVEQGEVWGAEEMEHAGVIRNQFRDMLAESTGDAELMRRDAHPKHHGCVRAELDIDNSKLKDAYKVGLFANNAKYNSIIRFSNGDPNHKKADSKADVRGMAVKVLDVPYSSYLEDTGVETQNNVHDFVFMNSKEFFIKNPKHYGKFMNAVRSGTLNVGLFAAGAFLNPTDHFVGILKKAFTMKVGNPLDVDYHSATPYKLGPTSMKMKFVSCKKNKDKVPEDAAPDFLSERLTTYLDGNSSCFDFYLQPNNNKRWNNIENAQKEWGTRKSPFVKVGRLNVLQQSKQSVLDRNKSCESMSFNPWRAPVENRPMGGVNRIRLEVYVKQAKMRQNYNQIEYPGPSKEAF